MKTKYKFIFVLFSLPFFCHAEPKISKLPSGKEITVLGLTKMIFTEADPGLMLKYETKIDLEDKEALRKEAEEIWPVFRNDVEKSGMDFAVISANSPPHKKYLIVEQRQSYNFSVTRSKNGTWEFKKWGRDYESEAQALANKFLKGCQAGNVIEVVDTLYIPDSYKGEVLIVEKKGLNIIVAGVFQHLGKIKSYKINDSIEKYKSLKLFAATPEFWKQHPYFYALVYDVDYSIGGKGLVILLFSIIDDKLVLNTVHYGIVESNKKSEEILEKINQAVQTDLSHMQAK